MDCTLMRKELLAYYFATLETAAEADAHLLECRDCLAAYLRLKHDIERSDAATMRPSDAMRERLRAEVLATFKPSLTRRLREWLERPVPRYRGVALATAVCLVLAVFVSTTGPKPPVHSDPSALGTAGALVDSSNTVPESLDFY